MSSYKISTDIHPEFVCGWPEETRDFYYGFFVGKTADERDNTYITLFNKSDGKIYKHSINVWESVDSWDYWFQSSHHGKYIIVTDYNGLTIFDDVLNVAIHIDVRRTIHTPESISESIPESIPDVNSSIDVWGYELNDNVLSYWSTNSVKLIESEYNNKMRELRDQINDNSTISKKEKRVAIAAIKYMKIYNSSYNIPKRFICRIKLEINSDDLENKVIVPTQQHYIYIFINCSLKMNNGKIASQISHLARTMTLTILKQATDSDIMLRYNDWIATGSKIIVSTAPESSIQKLALLSDSCVIIDEGYTQVEPNSLTVMGFFPSVYKPEFNKFRPDIEHVKKFANTYQQAIQDISRTVDLDINIDNDDESLASSMYFVVNKSLDITKYELIRQIFHITMEMTKQLAILSTDNKYMEFFSKWVATGAKTIVLKVDDEQITKISDLKTSHKLFNNTSTESLLSVIGFLPCTVDVSVLSSFKLY